MKHAPMLQIEEHYTAAEVAARLKLHRKTVLHLFHEGHFPRASKPFPNKVLIPAGDVEAFLARHRPPQLKLLKEVGA